MNKKLLMLATFLSLFGALSGFVCATVLTPGVLLEAEDPSLDHEGGSYNMPDFLSFWGTGFVRLNLSVEEHGYYKLLIRAAGEPCEGIWPLLEAKDAYYRMFNWDVDSPRSAPLVLVSPPLELHPGGEVLDLSYTNDAGNPFEDRNLF